MTTTLFVKANDRPKEKSISVRMYEVFLHNYKEVHPEEKIIELNLYKESLPYLGNDVINGRYAEIIDQHLQQFLEADKIVFAFPLWNLTVPAILHSYLDCMHHPGKTFSYSEEGVTGLLQDKKVVLLNARGGVYEEGDPSEMAVSFVKNHLQFFGITQIETVVIEGHHQYPDKSNEIISDGLQQVVEVANNF